MQKDDSNAVALRYATLKYWYAKCYFYTLTDTRFSTPTLAHTTMLYALNYKLILTRACIARSPILTQRIQKTGIGLKPYI